MQGTSYPFIFLIMEKRKDQKGVRVIICHCARFSDGVVHGG